MAPWLTAQSPWLTALRSPRRPEPGCTSRPERRDRGTGTGGMEQVARISFTGGPVAARHVLQNATNNFAEVSLELGGKSPVIVFDDANIESAVNGAVGAIFGASGQSCVAGSRLYLHERIAGDFLERMIGQARQIKIGDPLADDTQMGPLCTRGQLENIQREVTNAVAEGATILCGGKQPPGLGGLYFEPTIIDCPRQNLRLVDTELFGPVLSVLRFKDEDEVIRLANDTKHGLAAGIFTRSNGRALRVSNAIRASSKGVRPSRGAQEGRGRLAGAGRPGFRTGVPTGRDDGELPGSISARLVPPVH